MFEVLNEADGLFCDSKEIKHLSYLVVADSGDDFGVEQKKICDSRSGMYSSTFTSR